MSNDEGGQLRRDSRQAGGMLWDDAKHMLAMALPVVLGAVIGYLVAEVTGLFIGAGVGVLLVGLYLLWGAVGLLRDLVRWIRGRRSP
ncbi:hypothetical protein [Nocardioides sp. 616]|uniref:hypothetical protein n=1 Tax=Nocardioides sp. 616 TaxID=2268090 RepID=UPI0013B3AD36|nr:hypothetical protein [Nocardioides sp. 616]